MKYFFDMPSEQDNSDALSQEVDKAIRQAYQLYGQGVYDFFGMTADELMKHPDILSRCMTEHNPTKASMTFVYDGERIFTVSIVVDENRLFLKKDLPST